MTTPDLFHIRTWLEALADQNSPYARDVLKMLEGKRYETNETKVARLIAWAADPVNMILTSEDGWFCFPCNCQPSDDEEEAMMAEDDPTKVIIDHKPDCLHLWAKSQLSARPSPEAGAMPCGHLPQYQIEDELGEACSLCLLAQVGTARDTATAALAGATELLTRLSGWDMLWPDTTADAAYWQGEISKVLQAQPAPENGRGEGA